MLNKITDLRRFLMGSNSWRTREVIQNQRNQGQRSLLSVRGIIRWCVRLVLAFFIFSLVSVGLYRFVPVPLTPLMAIRAIEAAIDGQPVRFSKKWVPLEQISPRIQYAVVAAEDMRFFEHKGFDWEAIQKALKHNERSRRVRGGSTISQQVAKNVFLWPQRSWLRKGLEAYFTALIELTWSKKRIMEVYLNVVELGNGIYGVESAARHFYKKPAQKLNASEAALMAAVLPNPRRFLISHPSRYILFRRSMIQRRMDLASQNFRK